MVDDNPLLQRWRARPSRWTPEDEAKVAAAKLDAPHVRVTDWHTRRIDLTDRADERWGPRARVALENGTNHWHRLSTLSDKVDDEMWEEGVRRMLTEEVQPRAPMNYLARILEGLREDERRWPSQAVVDRGLEAVDVEVQPWMVAKAEESRSKADSIKELLASRGVGGTDH